VVCKAHEREVRTKILTGHTEPKKPLGRPKRGWEDNIKMDFREKETGV
jgi:hypothetical protein